MVHGETGMRELACILDGKVERPFDHAFSSNRFCGFRYRPFGIECEDRFDVKQRADEPFCLCDAAATDGERGLVATDLMPWIRRLCNG